MIKKWMTMIKSYSWLYSMLNIKKLLKALAGVAQWIEGQPAKQRVANLIPGQGTCLGCGPGPQ